MAEGSAKPIFNFCSGPAMIPTDVLQLAQRELLNYNMKGISVMEMSHRSPEFQNILHIADTRLRELLFIPNNYRVLFMQGGASLQFTAVPLNLLSSNRRTGFINTGYWSQKAMAEAQKYSTIVELASSEKSSFKSVPSICDIDVPANLDYLHLTPNETIGGVEFLELPDAGGVPIVADMSSNILSRQIDVSRYGLIYAGAQKNIGPAGLTVVIVREDLLHRSKHQNGLPRLLNYHEVNEQGSMANTPPTFAIYLANLVFNWLLGLGGVAEMELKNQAKASLLYDAIDQSDFISNDIDPKFRSRMNVPFFFNQTKLQQAFLQQAEQEGLLNLNGHRSIGGCRASIYNAMPIEGVEALTSFIKKFENNYV